MKKMKKLLTTTLLICCLTVFGQEKKSEETIFRVTEEQAIFFGCEKIGGKTAREKCTYQKIYEYIGKNIDSKLAIKEGIKGKYKIRVTIKIDREGNISEIITDSEHKKIDRKIKKAFKKFPQMIPNKQNNIPTATSFTIPVTLIGQ